MRKTILIAAASAFAVSAALAQGPGGDGGPGKGPGKGWRFNQENTRGWSMMSREERNEHRNRMLSVKTYDECVAYQQEHRKLMEARAKERGREIGTAPRRDMCERMKQAGRFQ